MNRARVIGAAVLVATALASWLAIAQPVDPCTVEPFKRLPRCLALADAGFTLAESFDFRAQYSLLPSQCPEVPTPDLECRVLAGTGEFECAFPDAGLDPGTMTDGVGQTYVSSFAHAPDGGWLQAINYVDDTANANRVPRINSAVIRDMFGEPHTILFLGYHSTIVNANGGWAGMITDGTQFLQARLESGQFRCLERGTGTTAVVAQQPLDGWSIYGCRAQADAGLTAISNGVIGTPGSSAITYGDVSAGSFFFAGGTGVCCTPAGSSGGPLLAVPFWHRELTDQQIAAVHKCFYGARSLQSGSLGVTGSTPTSIIGKDDTGYTGGAVNILAKGSYWVDPVTGIRSFQVAKNVAGTDALDICAGTDVQTPACTTSTAGAFFRWKNTNDAKLITDNDGTNFECKRSGSITGLDGGYGTFVNATAFLAAGTSGTTTDKARIVLTHDGVTAAGSATWDISGLTSTMRRYPTGQGAWAYVTGATSIVMDLCVGNTGAQTGSILASQWQLTPTAFPEMVLINNTQTSASWPELDGGVLPYGSTGKGKVQVVFRVPYTSAQAAGEYLTRPLGSYVVDAFDVTEALHNVLLSTSSFAVYDGGTKGDPGLQALMYGASASYENRFDITPISVDAGVNYVWSYEWRTATGVLPDAGFGVGCRAISRFNVCTSSDGGVDPTDCSATTIFAQNSGSADTRFPAGPNGQNTGGLGTCPLPSPVIDVGTRIAGSSPSVVELLTLKVYR